MTTEAATATAKESPSDGWADAEDSSSSAVAAVAAAAAAAAETEALAQELKDQHEVAQGLRGELEGALRDLGMTREAVEMLRAELDARTQDDDGGCGDGGVPPPPSTPSAAPELALLRQELAAMTWQLQESRAECQELADEVGGVTCVEESRAECQELADEVGVVLQLCVSSSLYMCSTCRLPVLALQVVVLILGEYSYQRATSFLRLPGVGR